MLGYNRAFQLRHGWLRRSKLKNDILESLSETEEKLEAMARALPTNSRLRQFIKECLITPVARLREEEGFQSRTCFASYMSAGVMAIQLLRRISQKGDTYEDLHVHDMDVFPRVIRRPMQELIDMIRRFEKDAMQTTK